MWVLQCLGIVGLFKGKTLAIDTMTLKVNASLRRIVHGFCSEAGRKLLSFADS
jgi:hypothetical protein